MNYPLILMIVLSIFVFYAINYMFRRGDDIRALSYFMLYVYTIFSQIGYVFYPYLSKGMSLYFGEEIYYDYWIFVFLSFVGSFIVYRLFFINKKDYYVFKIMQKTNNYSQLFYIFFSTAYLLIIAIYFILNKENIQYGSGNALGSLWYALFYRIYICNALILYMLYRNTNRNLIYNNYILTVLLLSILLILNISFTSGARSDIIFLFLGIVYYELAPFKDIFKKNKKKVTIIILLSFFLVKVLQGVMYLRQGTNNIDLSKALNANNVVSQDSFMAEIAVQDYYAPSHTLFISIYYNLVDFKDTFFSNFANSLFGIGYPVITQKVVSKVTNVDYDQRGIGIAYYLFTEGFNAMGWFGIIYNSIIWNLGMWLWLKFAKSNDHKYNKFVLAIIAMFSISLIRNQAGFFIKFLWMYMIPSLILLVKAFNYKISLVKKK